MRHAIFPVSVGGVQVGTMQVNEDGTVKTDIQGHTFCRELIHMAELDMVKSLRIVVVPSTP